MNRKAIIRIANGISADLFSSCQKARLAAVGLAQLTSLDEVGYSGQIRIGINR